ncbi:hypothetical protein YC2023_106456 [Brassica napus]
MIVTQMHLHQKARSQYSRIPRLVNVQSSAINRTQRSGLKSGTQRQTLTGRHSFCSQSDQIFSGCLTTPGDEDPSLRRRLSTSSPKPESQKI